MKTKKYIGTLKSPDQIEREAREFFEKTLKPDLGVNENFWEYNLLTIYREGYMNLYFQALKLQRIIEKKF